MTHGSQDFRMLQHNQSINALNSESLSRQDNAQRHRRLNSNYQIEESLGLGPTRDQQTTIDCNYQSSQAAADLAYKKCNLPLQVPRGNNAGKSQ